MRLVQRSAGILPAAGPEVTPPRGRQALRRANPLRPGRPRSGVACRFAAL